MGSDPHLPARAHAEPAPELAARRPSRAGRVGDLVGLGDLKSMKMELRKTFQFEAAHLLPRLPETHKCRRLHGHSFQVQVVVSGECDPRLGWLMDYAEIT